MVGLSSGHLANYHSTKSRWLLFNEKVTDSTNDDSVKSQHDVTTRSSGNFDSDIHTLLFLTHNTEYDTVLHPVLGGIVCLVARVPILPGDEVTADYLYELEDAQDWYVEQYYRAHSSPSQSGE